LFDNVVNANVSCTGSVSSAIAVSQGGAFCLPGFPPVEHYSRATSRKPAGQNREPTGRYGPRHPRSGVGFKRKKGGHIMAKQLRGVVIRVGDLEVAAKRYEQILGVAPTRIPDECFSLPGKVAGIRFDLGGSFVQFVAPVGDDSPLRASLEKLGEGLSQISFWVDDVDAEMSLLQSHDVRFTDDVPRDLPMGRVAFGHPKSLNGVMWELEEHTDVFR